MLLVVWLDYVVAIEVMGGGGIFERYGEGKSSACRNGLMGVFLVCMGNIGNIISQCCIYGKD